MHVDEVFIVVILSSEEMISNIVVLKCSVGISNRILFVDFIVFPIASFEVIIGMDFLSEYGAAIESQRKINQILLGNIRRI